MKKHIKRIFYYISIIYWLLATIKLINIIESNGALFSGWLSDFLYPGYFIGFILVYTGGGGWAFFGQLLTLFILLFLAFIPTKIVSDYKYRND